MYQYKSFCFFDLNLLAKIFTLRATQTYDWESNKVYIFDGNASECLTIEFKARGDHQILNRDRSSCVRLSAFKLLTLFGVYFLDGGLVTALSSSNAEVSTFPAYGRRLKSTNFHGVPPNFIASCPAARRCLASRILRL